MAQELVLLSALEEKLDSVSSVSMVVHKYL